MNDRGKLSPGVLVALLLALFWLQAITAVDRKSPTFDEPNHFVAGYTYWAGNDYRLNPEGGNWLQRWAALPLYLGHEPPYGDVVPALLIQGRMMMAVIGAALGLLVFLWSRKIWGNAGGFISLGLFVFSPDLLGHSALVTTDVGTAFFFAAATWSFWQMLHQLKWKTILLCGVCTGGLFLVKFSAVIFLPAAALMVIVRLTLGRSLHITWRSLCRHRLSSPPAEQKQESEWISSPQSKPLPLPVPRHYLHGCPKSVMIQKRRQQAAALVPAFFFIGLMAWGLIWASFGFRYHAPPQATRESQPFFHPENLPTANGIIGTAVATANRYRLLPEAYLYGFSFTFASAQQRHAFLRGNYSLNDGWRWFFPYAFLVKTPLPTLIILVLALLAIGVCRKQNPAVTIPASAVSGAGSNRSEQLYQMIPLASLFLVYFGVAIFSHINIGIRHLFPIYPGLFILAGGVSLWLTPKPQTAITPNGDIQVPIPCPAAANAVPGLARHHLVNAAILLLLLWQAVESWRIRPHYLAYFNPLDGGPQYGYQCLVDSSLDWGQDLPGLRDWLAAHRCPGQPVYLSYFGSTHPGYYDIDAILLPGFIDWRKPSPPGFPAPLRPGMYAISATMLQVGFGTCPGNWSRADEEHYQQCRDQFKLLETAGTTGKPEAGSRDTAPSDRSPNLIQDFEWFRFGRLRAYLKQREPDANVGYSILIYQLSDAELKTALETPFP